jgi:predicted negative regulator of RcsB-dependent stress response
LQNLTAFVGRRQKGVIVSLIALSTLLLTTFAWSYYSSQRDAAAQARLSHLISAFNQTVSDKSAKDGFERIIIEAQKIKDESGSPPVAQLAQYYIAISEESLGNTDRSVQHLRDLIRDGDPIMKSLAQFALGAIYRNHNDTQRAMEVYRELEASGAISRRESHSRNH